MTKMAAGHKATCGHCHNPMSLEGRTVCHLLPLLPQRTMPCLLIVFTLDEEALSRPSFHSGRTWRNLSGSLSHVSAFALLSEYSCGLNVDFQSLVFARTRKRGRSLCWGPRLSPHFWTPLGLTSQGPFHHWEWAHGCGRQPFPGLDGSPVFAACHDLTQELLCSEVFLLPLPQGSLCPSRGSLLSKSKDFMRQSPDSACSPSFLCIVSSGEVELQSSSPLANNV